MSEILSHEEIEALLGGSPINNEPAVSSSVSTSEDTAVTAPEDMALTNSGNMSLTNNQKDILGEIGNISMGTAATTLFALLNHKVLITTPYVKVISWAELSNYYDRPCVGVRVDYKEGLIGSNILILKERDARIISNLMMGGDGIVDEDTGLTDMDLSAIGEAMNQMIGSASTSLSSLIGNKIDIDTPMAFVLDFTMDDFFDSVEYSPDDLIACVSFKMEIGTLINSELTQVYPFDFALDVVDKMAAAIIPSDESKKPKTEDKPEQPAAPAPQPASAPSRPAYTPPIPETRQYQPQNVNVQPAEFQNFDVGAVMQQKENIEIIMDVPLEVSVELGRTHKKIKDILEFSPGSVIELDKLAGEPIDILVNGKFLAKGEVVVIDENFGIRITDIISVDKRV